MSFDLFEQFEPLSYSVVDNYCHLDIVWGEVGAFAVDDVFAQVSSVGVTRIVQIGCDFFGAVWVVETVEVHEQIVVGVVLHFNEAFWLAAEGWLFEVLAEIEWLARGSDQVRAVGELGFDYFRIGFEGRAAQHESFRAHIELARSLTKTFVVHDRDAHEDVVRLIDEVGTFERWVMHCFSGDAVFVRECLDWGVYLSFAGIVTFKNVESLREVLWMVLLDRILVETDVPFLTPTLYCGRTNVFFLMLHTVCSMAAICEADLAGFCCAIVANIDAVFGGGWFDG